MPFFVFDVTLQGKSGMCAAYIVLTVRKLTRIPQNDSKSGGIGCDFTPKVKIFMLCSHKC